MSDNDQGSPPGTRLSQVQPPLPDELQEDLEALGCKTIEDVLDRMGALKQWNVKDYIAALRVGRNPSSEGCPIIHALLTKYEIDYHEFRDSLRQSMAPEGTED